MIHSKLISVMLAVPQYCLPVELLPVMALAVAMKQLKAFLNMLLKVWCNQVCRNWLNNKITLNLQQATVHPRQSPAPSRAAASVSQSALSAEHGNHNNNKRQSATHCRSTISARIWCWFQRSLSPAGWPWLQLPVERPPSSCVSLQ